MKIFDSLIVKSMPIFACLAVIICLSTQTVRAADATEYSIGEPTAEEQLYLELVNRARANPMAEVGRILAATDPAIKDAMSFFKVDTNLMAIQFTTLPVAPPLAMNAKLLASARLHSQDMLTFAYQGHTNSAGKYFPQRITDQGYNWSSVAENVFSYAYSPWHGHVGFEVDWGGPLGGMQNPPGHRLFIHSTNFTEVGIGVVKGSNTVGSSTVGPQLVTQEFGKAQLSVPFITGVAYYDLNGNNFYDIGEGLGGVRVNVQGEAFFAVTAASGGYAVPVDGNGTYTVTFSGAGLASKVVTVTVANRNNVKVDFIPTYAPPVLSGPDPALVGRSNTYTFTEVGVATGYQWRVSERTAVALEGAENGTNRVTAELTSGYALITSEVKASGANSFHLAHPQAKPQYLTLNGTFLVGASASLKFESRLGLATSNQVGRAQISSNDGETWGDLWVQAGDGQGALSFDARSFSLARYSGQEVKIRFVYDFVFGGANQFFNQAGAEFGLFLDNIEITGVEELVNRRVTDVPSGLSFVFNPSAEAKFALEARAKLEGGTLDWGPMKLIESDNAPAEPPVVKITRISAASATTVNVEFELTSGGATSYQIETAPAVSGPWSASGINVETVSAGKFKGSASKAAAQQFFRVKATQ